METKIETGEKLLLIEGDFLTEEARDILLNLFQSKLSFHQLKNFSSQVKYGRDDETATLRIPALKKELDKLNALLKEAENKHKKLHICSEIRIRISEENKD
jgi:hypothetical protein